MAEVGFYHLQRTPLAQALPRLLEKAVSAGHRVLVKAPDAVEIDRLDMALWTWRADSFLPHGTAGDAFAEDQPIYLTTGDENPNGARLLVLVGGADTASLDGFDRCLDMFDGTDEAAVAAARARWQARRAEGHALTYWQQNEAGGWGRRG